MTEHEVWRSISAKTGAGDRAAAEAGVRSAYRQAGLREPERIIWAASPLAAVRMLSAGELGDRGVSVREALRS
ncbi:hypothetical protein ACQPW1_19450 [Nocardia sp. CA-128927]|uniref:hypothetical protein n=1 Tax=Nocardia sp. CA-128927 TaxID=3239975 RepID=UPI003D972FC1